MNAKSLQPYINQDLRQLIRPIEYLDGGRVVKGYNSLILPELCNMYLSARRDNTLVLKQLPYKILYKDFISVGLG